MRQKFKYIGGLIFLVLSLFLLNTQAQAALDLTLGTITDVNGSAIDVNDLLDTSAGLIDAYYSDPFGNDPRDTSGRLLLAPDKTTYDGNAPAAADDWNDESKYRGYISGVAPNATYFFTRHTDNTSPGGTIYIRVWSGTPNQEGSYYCRAKSFSNGTTSTVIDTLTAQTTYKAAAPYEPEIYQFKESTTTPVNGSPSSSLQVYSRQPSSPSDGIREVTDYTWEYGTDPDSLSDAGVDSATLSLDSNQLTSGQTYYFKVTHENWFGQAESSVVSYTLGAGVSGAMSLSITLYKQSDGYGVNDVIIPYASVYIDGNQITNLQELQDQIEAAGTKVTAIGIWDESSMSLKGATFDDQGNASYTSGISALSDVSLSAGDAVQVSVDTEVSITLTNQ